MEEVEVRHRYADSGYLKASVIPAVKAVMEGGRLWMNVWVAFVSAVSQQQEVHGQIHRIRCSGIRKCSTSVLSVIANHVA